jgi:hypothetical protein
VNLLPEATRVVQTLDASNTKFVVAFLIFLKGRCWGAARNYIGVRAGGVPPQCKYRLWRRAPRLPPRSRRSAV